MIECAKEAQKMSGSRTSTTLKDIAKMLMSLPDDRYATLVVSIDEVDIRPVSEVVYIYGDREKTTKVSRLTGDRTYGITFAGLVKINTVGERMQSVYWRRAPGGIGWIDEAEYTDLTPHKMVVRVEGNGLSVLSAPNGNIIGELGAGQVFDIVDSTVAIHTDQRIEFAITTQGWYIPMEALEEI